MLILGLMSLLTQLDIFTTTLGGSKFETISKEADVVMKDSMGKKRELCLDFDESDDEDGETYDNQVVRREIENYKSEEPLLDKSDPLD